MYRILVVDDEEKIRALIRKYAEFEAIPFVRRRMGWKLSTFVASIRTILI